MRMRIRSNGLLCANAALSRTVKGPPANQLKVNDSREYRYREYQHQPFNVVARQKSGEMHYQDDDGDDVVDDEKHFILRGRLPFQKTTSGYP